MLASKASIAVSLHDFHDFLFQNNKSKTGHNAEIFWILKKWDRKKGIMRNRGLLLNINRLTSNKILSIVKQGNFNLEL